MNEFSYVRCWRCDKIIMQTNRKSLLIIDASTNISQEQINTGIVLECLCKHCKNRTTILLEDGVKW